MRIYKFIAIFYVLFVVIGASIVHSDDKIITVPIIIKEAKLGISEVTVEDVKNDMVSEKKFVFLDVRTAEEFNAGHLPSSVNIPRGILEFIVEKKFPVKETNIVLYCRTDPRAALCTKTLNDMGYINARNLKGGFKAWGEAGYPVYNRHGEFKMVAFEKKE